jgi:citrate lyase beta subunit
VSTFSEADLARWSTTLPQPTLQAARWRPLHTVYGGAHLFKATTPDRLGALALAHLERHGKDPGTFARVLGLPPTLAEAVWDRSVHMLRTHAVQDYRIDFEDGFGPRTDDEEDAAAVFTGQELATCLRGPHPPPGVGIRIRAFEGPTFRRAVRTLERFLRALADHGGTSGRPFVVTLPKATTPGPVQALAEILDQLEQHLGLRAHAIGLELMVETPAALITPDGRCGIPALVQAAAGRCVAAHLGAYDLTAACGVPAADQTLDHPLCDHARAVLQLSLAGTGVAVVDGATTVLPVGPHRGDALSRGQVADNDRVVHEAWRQHARNIRRALAQGIPQGWDLHPGQIPVRFGVCSAVFLEGLPVVAERLRRFVDNAARATRTGATFDDAATGQGLLNLLRTGHAAGILTDADVRTAGVTPDELGLRFDALLARRQRSAPTLLEP